jgi:hypothetical protein
VREGGGERKWERERDSEGDGEEVGSPGAPGVVGGARDTRRGRGGRLWREGGGQVLVVVVGGEGEAAPNGRLSYTSAQCWEALTPPVCVVSWRTCTSR